MGQRVWIGCQCSVMVLFALGLVGCLTTFSAGSSARPVEPYRTSGSLDEDLNIDVPTPQLFNFGFDLLPPVLNEP